MRVTNKMLSNNFLRDMRTNLNNLSTLQNQRATGKLINKPSDDPAKASKIMKMYSEIDANKQYNSNIKDTTNWLDVTDTALGQVGGIIGEIENQLQSTGSGYGEDERQAIKDVINQKIGELSQMLNTTFDGKYIFGGTDGTSKPVDTKTVGKNTELVCNTKSQESDKLLVEISQGVTMDYNITASQAINYGNGDNENIMKLLGDITSHLDSTNPEDIKKLINEDLSGIKKAGTNVLKLRSEVGAKQNRMESAKDRNVDQNFNMTEILASTENIDVVEKTMEYATMQNIYMASLQTSAQVLQPTLLDYLR